MHMCVCVRLSVCVGKTTHQKSPIIILIRGRKKNYLKTKTKAHFATKKKVVAECCRITSNGLLSICVDALSHSVETFVRVATGKNSQQKENALHSKFNFASENFPFEEFADGFHSIG